MGEGLRVLCAPAAPSAAAALGRGLAAVALVQLDGLGELVVQLHFGFLGGERGDDPAPGAAPQRSSRAGRTADENRLPPPARGRPLWGLLPAPNKATAWGPGPRPRELAPHAPLDPGLLLSLPGLQESAPPRRHTQGLPGTTPSPGGPRDRDWGHFTGTRAELMCSQRGAASCFLGKKIHLSLRHGARRSRSSGEPAPITVLATPRTALF